MNVKRAIKLINKKIWNTSEGSKVYLYDLLEIFEALDKPKNYKLKRDNRKPLS